jgi:hypothetical protein
MLVPMPQRELDGLVARETLDGTKVILPVWHGVDAAEITAASPTLAARLAAHTEGGIDRVADEVVRALRAATDAPSRIATAQIAAPAFAAGDPGAVHDAVIAVLRAGDEIELDRTLRAERAAFESAVNQVTADYLNKHLDEGSVRDAGGRLVAAAERRLASLIPLAMYRKGALSAELRAHGGWMTRTKLQGGGATWQEAWRLPWWLIGYSLGPLLCRQGRFGAVRELVGPTWMNRFGEQEAFIGHPGELGDALAKLLGQEPPAGRTWSFPAWSWWRAHISECGWLRDRYPDWLEGPGEPEAAMVEFSMIEGLSDALKSGATVVAFWTIDSEHAADFARRLHGDEITREEVAAAVGLDLATFDARAPEVLAEAHGVGAFPRTREIANILRTGSYR